MESIDSEEMNAIDSESASRPTSMKSGLPERFASGVTMNYAAAVVNMAVGLVITPLLLDRLGTEAFAIWVLAGATGSYLELFELGFGVATTKLVAEDAGRDTPSLLKTINSSLAVLSLLGIAAVAVGLVVATVAPVAFQISDGLHGDAVMVFMLMAVTIGISIPGDVFGGVLAGHQRYDLLSASNLALAAVGGAAAVVVALAGGDVVSVVLATSTISVLMHGVRYWLVRRIVPGVRFARNLVERRQMRATAGLSGWLFLRDLALTIIYRVDLAVVAVILGPKQAAVYAVGLKLAQLSEKMLIPLSQVFLPHASALDRVGDTARLGALLTDGTRAAMVPGAFVMLALALLADRAVPAWVGPGFGEAVEITIILTIALGLRSVTTTAWQMLTGVGKGKSLAALALAEAAVNLAVSVVLTYALGIVGPAIGTLVGVVVLRVPLVTVMGCRVAHLSVPVYIERAIRPHFAAIALTAATFLIARPLTPSSGVSVLGSALLGFVVYLLSYWLTGATHAERKQVTAAVGKILKIMKVGGA